MNLKKGVIMILVRSFLIASALFVSSASFANDTEANVEPTYDRYWQCQAHSSHGDWNIYTGQVSYDKHEAQHSALYTCQANEGHKCRLHRCRRVSGYNNGTNY